MDILNYEDKLETNIPSRYEIKRLDNGVHQLIIRNCEVLDLGKVECVCVDLKTNATLEVKRKETKPEVDGDDQDDDDGRIKGKYKGRNVFFSKAQYETETFY